MRLTPSLLTVSLALSACSLAGPASTPDKRGTGLPATTAKTAASQAPTTPASKAPAKLSDKDALLKSLGNALSATRASRLSTTLTDTSGIIANNGSSVISDNGLGLISDNGLGLIGNNGLGYRLQADDEIAYTSEMIDLVYYFRTKTMGTPRSGVLKVYDAVQYKAATPQTRETALLDEFAWDDIGMELGYGGVALQAAISFPMRPVTSKRFPFLQKLNIRRIVKLKGLSGADLTDVGWQYDFEVSSTTQDGSPDKALFKAVAGEKDLKAAPTADGTHQTLPVRMDVTGTNATGKYVGVAKVDTHRLDFTHTATDGIETRISFETPFGKPTRLEVESVEAKLMVVADLKAGEGGAGTVVSTAGPTPKTVGTLVYDVEGLATITFDDGTTLKAGLF